jgi:hypothetical protein
MRFGCRSRCLETVLTTVSVKVVLSDASDIERLFMQCHRCAYRDASVNRTRGAKASVRLNGKAWISLDDVTAAVEMPEKGFGGIAGGFFTTRFSVPVQGAGVGENVLEFRFNATDGVTSGFRILHFNFLKKDGSAVLMQRDFVRATPRAFPGGNSMPTTQG